MKNLCLECDVDCKLEYCCHSNPETRESVTIHLKNGEKVRACPNFDSEGYCIIHEFSRPEACSEYYCHKYSELPLTELFAPIC